MSIIRPGGTYWGRLGFVTTVSRKVPYFGGKSCVNSDVLERSIFQTFWKQECCTNFLLLEFTSHSAYAATETESVVAKIDGLLPPNFL